MPVLTCPVCGAQNDPMNRFCDQCGTRLDPGAAQPVSPEVVPLEQPGSGALHCSNCGASVLFGQAFCDECGFPVNNAYADPALAANDMPTMIAPSLSSPATGTNNDVTLIAPPLDANKEAVSPATPPIESSYNAPTVEVPAVSPVAPAPDQAVAQATAETIAPAPDQAAAQATAETIAPAPDQAVAQATAETIAPAPDQAMAPATVEPVAPHEAQTDPAGQPVSLPAGSAPVAAVDEMERQRLMSLIATHRETIAQYEQMLARYPVGAAPAFLTAGMDEARQAIVQAETELTALDFGPDPAEVSRLESLVQAHRETVGQYDQMIGRYPPNAAPAFLTAGLDEARRALSRTEAELAGLTGAVGTPVVPPSAGPSVPARAETSLPSSDPVSAPVTAPATGPRLVLVNGGTTLPFPANKQEITIGREDPVSQIFPEIDLTPYGGESGGVSRQHARISQQNAQWVIIDLDSTNYTRVDGRKIEPHTPTPIQNGSQVQFGRIAMIFQV